MPLEFVENVLAPIDNNKYIRGLLLVVLLVSSGYFVPHPIVPRVVVQVVHNYAFVSFLLTLLLAYLLTSDINVAVVVAIAIFVLGFITKKVEGFESVDYVNQLVNQYNAQLDREENSNVSQLQYKRPQEVPNAVNRGEAINQVNNIARTQVKEKLVGDLPAETQFNQQRYDASKIIDFDFTDDSLRYLTYDQKKLNKFQENVLNDQFTGNQVHPF